MRLERNAGLRFGSECRLATEILKVLISKAEEIVNVEITNLAWPFVRSMQSVRLRLADSGYSDYFYIVEHYRTGASMP